MKSSKVSSAAYFSLKCSNVRQNIQKSLIMNTDRQLHIPGDSNQKDENKNQNIDIEIPLRILAEGFGPDYFNVRDPKFTKTNVPVKRQGSAHIPIIICNIFFVICLIFAIIGFNKLFGFYPFLMILIFSYALYLITVCSLSEIRQYLENMRKYNVFQDAYGNMVSGRGYFIFKIQCYHYRVSSIRRNRRRRKVVTHTAKEIFNCAESMDESGQIANIDDVKNFVFLHCLKRYYFSDNRSQQIFNKAYSDFVDKNKRDTYQYHSRTFQIQNFEEFTCYSGLGENKKIKILFYIFTTIGLALPFALIFEHAVARYDMGILKRLTV